MRHRRRLWAALPLVILAAATAAWWFVRPVTHVSPGGTVLIGNAEVSVLAVRRSTFAAPGVPPTPSITVTLLVRYAAGQSRPAVPAVPPVLQRVPRLNGRRAWVSPGEFFPPGDEFRVVLPFAGVGEAAALELMVPGEWFGGGRADYVFRLPAPSTPD